LNNNNESDAKRKEAKKLFLVTNQISSEIKKRLDPNSWLSLDEGKFLTNLIIQMSPLVAMGDPIGMLIPSVIYLGDLGLRDRFLRRTPKLMEAINAKRAKINMDFLQSELGQQMLRDNFDQIVHEIEDEKVNRIKNFFVSSCLDENPDQVYIRNCHRILLSMDGFHVRLISILENPEEAIRETYRAKIKELYNSMEFKEIILNPWIDINKYYLHIDNFLYNKTLGDLEDWGIFKGSISFESSYPLNEEKIVEDLSERIGFTVTSFGRRFLKYIKDHE